MPDALRMAAPTAVAEDDDYLPGQLSPEALEASIRRLHALKRRESWQRRAAILCGALCMLIGFWMLPAVGLPGTGVIFVPVGLFIAGWGALRSLYVLLYER